MKFITVLLALLLTGCMASAPSKPDPEGSVSAEVDGSFIYVGTYTRGFRIDRTVYFGGFVDGKTGMLWKLQPIDPKGKNYLSFEKIAYDNTIAELKKGNKTNASVVYTRLKGKPLLYDKPNSHGQVGTILVSEFLETRRPRSFVPPDCNVRSGILCSSEGMMPYKPAR